MATTTPNYGWSVPTSTDLVKDGATAIETLGDSVDATVKALNPETTLGDIAYRSSTANTNTRLAVGTNGQILTVAAGVPSWATPATAAGWTLLSTTTLSGAATTISSISQSYSELMISIEDYFCAANASLYFQFNSDSTANAHNKYLFVSQNGTVNYNASAGTEVYWTYGTCAGADNNNGFNLKVQAYANTTSRKMFTMNSEFQNGAGQKELYFGNGAFNSTTAISSIKIGTSSTWSQGTVKIYGC